MLLADLEVVILDCQATGATPELGDLLELGWGSGNARELLVPPRASWIVPRSGRPVPRIVKKLTGYEDAFAKDAISENDAWARLSADLTLPSPTVIHFATFELRFLRDLHARLSPDTPFPFDTLCLHAIAQRLHPDLPRRGLRAIAGYLGHPAELVRRSNGHVEASAFLWRAFVPALENVGVRTWEDLRAWIAEPAPKSSKRVFAITPERRKTLTTKPGVYRFLRSNGDVLYVGKAANVKTRIAAHFSASSRGTERSLEMLTQAHDIAVTETATALEAALLETDEIKRIDPPYNVHLREGARRAWFSSRSFDSVAEAPDALHTIGPLPSADALEGLGAMRALLAHGDPTLAIVAATMGVPEAFAAPEALFREGWSAFIAEHGLASDPHPFRALLRLSIELWIDRANLEESPDDAPPSGWDLPRVRRRIDRMLVRGGQLLRRARWLALLSDSAVAFREKNDSGARLLVIADAAIVDARDHDPTVPLPAPPLRRSRAARQASFDAARYDRLRVLATELRRVHTEGGTVTVRLRDHILAGPRIASLLRAI